MPAKTRKRICAAKPRRAASIHNDSSSRPARARAASHAARLRRLFLDTMPYNAHNTAVEALWAGMPLVTCAGKSICGAGCNERAHHRGITGIGDTFPRRLRSACPVLRSGAGSAGGCTCQDRHGARAIRSVRCRRRLSSSRSRVHDNVATPLRRLSAGELCDRRSINPTQRCPGKPQTLQRVLRRQARVENIIAGRVELLEPAFSQNALQQDRHRRARNRRTRLSRLIEMMPRSHRDIARAAASAGDGFSGEKTTFEIDAVPVGQLRRQIKPPTLCMERRRGQQPVSA